VGFNANRKNHQAVIGDQVSADSVQKSPLESSNSTISTDLSAQKPLIARAPFNGRNIPVEAPSRGNGMSLPGGIQRQQEEPPAVMAITSFSRFSTKKPSGIKQFNDIDRLVSTKAINRPCSV
jgi:hypothetical protein